MAWVTSSQSCVCGEFVNGHAAASSQASRGRTRYPHGVGPRGAALQSTAHLQLWNDNILDLQQSMNWNDLLLLTLLLLQLLPLLLLLLLPLLLLFPTTGDPGQLTKEHLDEATAVTQTGDPGQLMRVTQNW